MRVVIQRVSRASVSIGNEILSSIGHGLLILVGFEKNDTIEDIEWACNKIINLRIFNDAGGVMNLSIKETNGSILVISQFTLHALTKKGNRPSYIRAAEPAIAIPLYEKFVNKLSDLNGGKICTGRFGAKMSVELINEGPVTIIIDTKNKDF